MRTLSLTLALLLAMLLVQPGGPAVADGHGAAAGACHCEHHGSDECVQDHCTPLCAAACAGGCGPVPFLQVVGILIPPAIGPQRVQPQAERYADITLPVPHPPPNA